MVEFNADRVAELIREAGFKAWVWQSGGGCATIRAGEEFTDAEGDERVQLLLGPGSYGYGVEPSMFNEGELYAGPDGDAPGVDVLAAGATTEADVARIVVDMLRDLGPVA